MIANNRKHSGRCALIVALLSTAPAHAVTVGTTPGQFAVSESGAATYTIPIAVPPGTAGMEPKLALSYNSQSGNGLLGVGWSLSGLSAITRCPRTIAQDGVIAGIEYSTNDKYCLDGQRLVAINGAYGANGTEYRTEQESFAKVISFGVAGNGPAWFKVWTKSGQIMEYGNSDDSRIEAQGKTSAAVWAVNKISDTKSNFLTVTYTEDNPNGQFYPNRIDYTGNANMGRATYNSVRFVYETRPDVVPLYQAGSVNKTTVRLTNFQSYAGTNTLVRDYRLAYEQSTLTESSRLLNLKECVGDGACLPATSFGWQSRGVYTPVASQRGQHLLGHPYGIPGWIIPLDYDGDGYQDLVVFNSSADRWYTVAHNNHNGTFTRVAQGQGFLGFPYGSPQSTAVISAFDYNGDGKQDLLFVNSSADGWYMVAQSNGDGTFTRVAAGQRFLGHPYGVPGWVIPLDYNGDGRQDIAIFNSSEDRWYTIGVNNGDGTFTKVAQAQNFLGFPYGSPQSTETISAFDYNGDGKQDLFFVNSSPDGWYMIARSNGDGTFAQVAKGQRFLDHPYGIPGWIVPFDFNGDGLLDIAIFNSSEDRWYTIGVNKGDGTFSRIVQGQNFFGFPYGSPQSTFPIIAADFNQDNKTDLAFFNSTPDRWYMFILSNGDGTFRTLSSGQSFLNFPYSSPQSTATIMSVDSNGTGRPELLFLNDSADGAYQFAQIYNGATPDLVGTFNTGLNATTSVTYKPLTDESVYSKDAAAAYPNIDIQAPIYVVSRVAASDGIGGEHVTNYSYAGAKSRHLGGGFLGFRETRSHDPQAKIQSITTYRQDYPYHGAPLSTEKRTDGNVLISRSVTTYTDQLLNPTLSPVWRKSEPTHTVESSYELNGNLITTTTTSQAYDAFGNTTRIVVSSNDGHVKTTVNNYDNDPVNWILGRLRRATVTSTTP